MPLVYEVVMYSEINSRALDPAIYKASRYKVAEFSELEPAIKWITDNTFVPTKRVEDESNGGRIQIQIEKSEDGKLTVIHHRNRNTPIWPPLPPKPAPQPELTESQKTLFGMTVGAA